MGNLNNYASSLNMRSLIFKKLYFDLHDDKSFNHEDLFIRMKRDINDIGDDIYDITLHVYLSKNKSEFEDGHHVIYVEVTGNFCVSTDDIDFKTSLIEQNTIAIMFPYIRSQLTLLTSQPGCTPLVLPVLNINKLFQTE